MKPTLIFGSIGAALLSGCALFSTPGIPATTIKFNPKTDVLAINSPKDVTIGSVTVTQSASNFNITVINYASTNDPALVGVVAAAQAAIASNAAVTINNLAGLAAQAAGKIP